MSEYQTWENGANTVLLERNCTDKGRYYVNAQGTPEILRTLEAKFQAHNEQAYCEWSSGDKKLLTVFQYVLGSSEFGGEQILALLGEKLANLGYSKT